ncbi:ABC transporter permease [Hydrogenoanaerobacterium sp.]|uniref:ABC transporter permease n=1 Tax=Hydrogenoanaerobacterium sp. TaxID=2953763 RepID=UPI0028999DBB|nr:ABC transporter permease [Hydrogenoanaerobacterium sp.]
MKPNKQDAVGDNSLNSVSNQYVLKKISTIMVLSYFFLSVVFYFLAGEQLHLRESRGNLNMPVANSGSIELVAGSRVEQIFVNEIQRLESISVAWGTYNRANTGTVFVDLFDLSGNIQLMHQELFAADITEGFVSTITSEKPIEGLYGVPLLLRITADSNTGSALSPLMNTTAPGDGFQLHLNEQPVSGMLCFSVQGEDYIWTGLHYWKFVVLGAIIILVYFLMVSFKLKRGKRCLPLVTIYHLQKYSFLIKQLVARDFKTKYKRSVLGVLWSFLNPLLTMTIQYLVFSNLFRFDIPNYPVYLISGIIMFNFFTESCGLTLASIVGNASLIKKVYVPKYIYPLTRVLSSLINLLISLIPLLAVVLFSGLRPTKAYFLLPFELICLFVFCLGIGMILASSMVFFRDTQFLWGILSMIWMYMTPLFYPESILPQGMRFVLKTNPMHFFVKFTRIIIIDGVSPEPIMYVQCALFALASLLIGSWIFKKTQDKFVLYL